MQSIAQAGQSRYRANLIANCLNMRIYLVIIGYAPALSAEADAVSARPP